MPWLATAMGGFTMVPGRPGVLMKMANPQRYLDKGYMKRVAPDIYVENTPKEVIAGHDPQLERAVQEGMRLLKDTKNLPATAEPPFPTWGKRVKPPTR